MNVNVGKVKHTKVTKPKEMLRPHFVSARTSSFRPHPELLEVAPNTLIYLTRQRRIHLAIAKCIQ